ncbi:unnamed protein product [Lupinus luteus]|uniref:Transmembrane protein n=1 Tax=Lupinus luteus TaxID=3873 RepID=A0AAV1XWF0_LUPLU
MAVLKSPKTVTVVSLFLAVVLMVCNCSGILASQFETIELIYSPIYILFGFQRCQGNYITLKCLY